MPINQSTEGSCCTVLDQLILEPICHYVIRLYLYLKKSCSIKSVFNYLKKRRGKSGISILKAPGNRRGLLYLPPVELPLFPPKWRIIWKSRFLVIIFPLISAVPLHKIRVVNIREKKLFIISSTIMTRIIVFIRRPCPLGALACEQRAEPRCIYRQTTV